MGLLTMFFALSMLMSASILIVATLPSRGERVVRMRMADIRNPRRRLQIEAGEADLEVEEATTLSQRLGRYLKQFSFAAVLEQQILEADDPGTVGLMALKGVEFAVCGAFAGFVLRHSGMLALGLGGCGLALPGIQLRRKRSKRLKAITAALPDTADLLARALRAGHSMTQAIEVLAERAPQPLAGEFGRVFQQQKLGVALREVLLELSARVPLKDLHFLITAILVQRDTGGDLAEILDRTSRVLRERIRVQGEMQVHTAQGRLTGWILSLLPIGLLGVISLFSPGYASILFSDPLGKKLLGAGVVSICIGAMIIRKLVEVNF